MSGASGQSFARLANALYTVALVPLFIRSWGVAGYGEWLSLIALASYGSYFSLGLITTGTNDVIMAAGAGNMARARIAYQVSINLSFYLVLPVSVAASLIAILVPFDRLLHLTSMSSNEAALLFGLVLFQLWMTTLRYSFGIVICAKGLYSWVFTTEGAVRLAELLLVAMALAVFRARPTTVAAISSGTAVFEFLVTMRLRRGTYDWARMDLRAWDKAWLRSLVRPSIGFWLSNLTTQNIMLQGPRVALGIILGGQAVAIYSIFATANRLVDQLVMLLASPFQIEVAQSWERRELVQAYRLVTLATQVAWLLFICSATGLMVTGPSVFPYWTAGKVSFDAGLMALFLVMAAGAQVGRISSQVLLSANRMFEPSMWMLLAGCCSLAIGALLSPAIGLPGMLIGGIAGELIISILAVRAMCRWLGKDVRTFLADLLDVSTLRRWLAVIVKRVAALAG